MKVVLDTNVLLQAIPRTSRFRPIWEAFLNETIDLCITTSVLLEYEEQIALKTSEQVALNIVALLNEAPNTHFINVYYEWNAVTADYDDNKFFDVAVAANAHYLVTNDSHFNEVKNRSFPKINIISAEDFLAILSKNKTEVK